MPPRDDVSDMPTKILVVEDSDDLAEAMCEILRADGREVRRAHDGEEGLLLLRDKPLPDLVMLDWEMPRLDGPGMLADMERHDAGEEFVPVLLVSGKRGLAALAASLRVRWFLSKPFGLDPFMEAVARALAGGLRT